MVECALVVGDRERVVGVIKRRHVNHVGKESPRMMFQAGWILAQPKSVCENTSVAGSVDNIARADLFALRSLKLDSAFVDLNTRDFGFLAGHRTVMDSQIVEIGVNILAEPMVFIPGAGAKLQPLLRVVRLARAMKDVSEMAFDS